MADESLKLDSKALKTLAHPLRTRLLTALRRGGPATATDLAEELDTNSGATSYHLRELAKVGLVEDSGEGTGRRRVWRAASRYHSWQPSDFTGDPDAQASLAWLTGDYLATGTERAMTWNQNAANWPAEWQDVLGNSDDVIAMTPEQTWALQTELDALLKRFRREAEQTPDDPRAVPIAIWALLFPADPGAPAPGAPAPGEDER